jgi:hypothetical protein
MASEHLVDSGVEEFALARAEVMETLHSRTLRILFGTLDRVIVSLYSFEIQVEIMIPCELKSSRIEDLRTIKLMDFIFFPKRKLFKSKFRKFGFGKLFCG